MSYFTSTRKYQIDEYVRVPDLGICRVIHSSFERGMYKYTCYAM